MGAGSSTKSWKGYDKELLGDNDPDKRQIAEVFAEEKGTTAIMRHPSAKDAFPMYQKDGDGNELNSGWAIANSAFKKHGEHAMFGYRPFLKPKEDISERGAYEWTPYKSVQKQVYALANGLKAWAIPDKSNIGIFSSNREEWLLAHLANWNLSYRTVALYDTLGAQAVQYIVQHAELQAIFVEKDKLPALFEAIRSCADKVPLKYIVQFDAQSKYNNAHEDIADDDQKTAQSFDIKLVGLSALLSESESTEITDMAPSPNDLAYIMYTSGTTGNPKGVMLSHQAFACCVASVNRYVASYAPTFNPSDRYVSYLPLAHIFESCVQLSLVCGGARIAFFNGNIKKISLDWMDIAPTVLAGVPRIFNKTHDKVHLKLAAAGGVKKWLFERALSASSKSIKKNGARSSFYDKVMWSKVAAQIGYHKVRFLVSGAAPLPPHIGEFLRIVCKDALIVQGYGLTETCGGSFITAADDPNLGHVGAPVDNCEFRLVDAPECEYFVSDSPCPRGEIEMRGPMLMRGYFKNEEATRKVLSGDQWFSTGDIGRINPNGSLTIIDRRKNMFKTANGEYVAAEKCEGVYSKAQSVGQLWIYGNSFKSFVVAVVVPDALWLVPRLAERGLWKDEGLTPATAPYCDKFKSICADHYDTVKLIVQQNIESIARESNLKRFEQIRDFHVEYELDELLQGFNVANDCLTPTFKARRPQLLRRYVEQIKGLYAANGEPANENEHWV